MSVLPSPVLVADAATLSDLVTDLAASTTVAVDTESNSLHAYRERVCLMQFSTATADYIVDPLALPDLDALAPFFASQPIDLPARFIGGHHGACQLPCHPEVILIHAEPDTDRTNSELATEAY